MPQEFDGRNIQGLSFTDNNFTDTNLSEEVALVCTDADREEISKFYEQFDRVQEQLNDPDFQFDKAYDRSIIKTWRQALVACNYSSEDSEDIAVLVADLNSSDEIARQVAYAVLLEMGSKAIPALTSLSNSKDENIRELATKVIREIGREVQVRQWFNAVWKYLRNRRK